MIGHALLTFTAEQEDRVLTQKMGPWVGSREECLLRTAFGVEGGQHIPERLLYWKSLSNCPVGERFDDACRRFGRERINTAIRNRILANRVWRALQGVRETVTHEEAVWE